MNSCTGDQELGDRAAEVELGHTVSQAHRHRQRGSERQAEAQRVWVPESRIVAAGRALAATERRGEAHRQEGQRLRGGRGRESGGRVAVLRDGRGRERHKGRRGSG